MRLLLQNLGCEWVHTLLWLPVALLVFSGSLFTHSPGHHYIHTEKEASSSAAHRHINVSDNIEIGPETLLHCGADISANTRDHLFGRRFVIGSVASLIAKSLNPFHTSPDPPPPRILA